MTPTITLVRDYMGSSLLRYAEVMGRTLADTTRRAARGVTRRTINITPPSHSTGGPENSVTGAQAYRYGRVKIKKDMLRVLAPVRLKGKRTEQHPDVAATYRRHRVFRQSGVGVRSQNLRARKYFVDQRKFNAELKRREGRVGRLASGWSAGAAALDLPVQNWIARHGRSRGAVKLDLVSSRMRIVVTNHSTGLSDSIQREMDRRISAALYYQGRAMTREVDYYAGKVARDLAIKTRNFSPIVPEGMEGG